MSELFYSLKPLERLYYCTSDSLVFLYHDKQHWYEYIGGIALRHSYIPGRELWLRAEDDDDIDLILTSPTVYSPATPLHFLLFTGRDLSKSLQDAGLELT